MRLNAAILGLVLLTGGCVAGVRTEREVAFAEITEFAEVRVEEMQPGPPPVKGPPPLDPVAEVDVPPFVVTSDLGEIEVPPYTVCWSGPNSDMCADGFPEPDRHLLAVREQLTVAFEPADTFTAAASTSIDDDRTELDWTAVDGGWQLNVFPLEPGDYVLWLDWIGAQGDAHAALTLRVMIPG